MTVALCRQQTLQQWQLAPTEWRPCSLQTDRRSTQSVLSSSTATRSRCSDPAYIDQLKQWLRFSCTDAVRSRDGLFSATTGNLVVPAILGGSLFALVATADSENKKSLAQIASSSGLAILFPSRTTRLTGRPPVAPTSALHCRQWRWVSNMPSSTKRSSGDCAQTPCCASRLASGAPTSSSASATLQRCPCDAMTGRRRDCLTVGQMETRTAIAGLLTFARPTAVSRCSVRTKTEENANLRVQYMCTRSHNYLRLQLNQHNPSSAPRRSGGPRQAGASIYPGRRPGM